MPHEFCVVMVQYDRVSFVNHQWIGSQPMDPSQTTSSLESCPWVWEWLTAASAEGWELVATLLMNPEQKGVTMYLRRPRG